MAFDKVRIRFRKAGDLRFVSHLDLMRSLERLLRRAAIPFRSTEGFHPTPRLVLAQSLSLGLIGQREVLELELTEPIEPPDLLDRLNALRPPGIDFLSGERIPVRVTARPRRGFYRITGELPDLSPVATTLLNQSEIWVNREKPKPRQVNIRPYLDRITAAPGELSLVIWITQSGSARTDEIIRLFDLPPQVVEGLLVERTFLELLDEVDPDVAQQTPVIEPAIRPWDGPRPERNTDAVPDEIWGATSNGPIVE